MNCLQKWITKGKMQWNLIAKGKALEPDAKKLLKDKRVVEEINRHKWLESEIAGFDIGFEKASEDWIENYAQSWLAYHDPQLKHFGKSAVSRNTKLK